jgi:RNA polymerase sigma factor (sigma-70 family)
VSAITRPALRNLRVNPLTSVGPDVGVNNGINVMRFEAPSSLDSIAGDWVAPDHRRRVVPIPTPEPVPNVDARFEALMVQYDRLIRSIVARVGRRMGFGRDSFLLREDIEQEVRLDLWKQVARGQMIEFPATYIYKATIRETLRALRRQAARAMDSIDGDGVADTLREPGDPLQLLMAKEKMAIISLGLRALAPDRQNAVRAHLAGFQFQEIMLRFGWSYQRARNLIARGMADLRKSLDRNDLEAVMAFRAALRKRRRCTVQL